MKQFGMEEQESLIKPEKKNQSFSLYKALLVQEL